jgi:hypothetical protein
MPDLKFYVRPGCKKMYGAPVGVVGGMVHELIVEGDPAIVEYPALIKEFCDIFPAVTRELAVPDHETISARCEEVAMRTGDPVGQEGNANVVC